MATTAKKLTNSKNLKKGDKLSYTQYFEVQSVDIKNESINVTDDSGRSLTIKGHELIEEMSNTSQFEETKKVSRTELAEIFKNHPRVVMTVNYNLKVEPKEVIKSLQNLYPNKGKIVSKVEFDEAINSNVKNALEGKERTIVGRHYSSFDDFGRASFVDMEDVRDSSKEYDTRTRKVDPRTINWVIVNNVKYIVGK